MATILVLIQYASLHAIATHSLPSNLSEKEQESHQKLKSRQLYQANASLRFLLYRLYIISDSIDNNTSNDMDSKILTQQHITTSQLFHVHLLKAFFAADVNATALIKELLVMTSVVIINKLTANRPIEKSTAYTLLCAYQARYPQILPVPPPVSSLSSSRLNNSNYKNGSRKMCTTVFRNSPDSIFDSRSSIITTTTASVEEGGVLDQLLNLLNKFGDSYFQVCTCIRMYICFSILPTR